MNACAWTSSAHGVVIDVRLTPRSARDQIEGLRSLSDGRAVIAVRVRAVPEDGKANDALLQVIARSLDVRVSDCALESGGKSRLKSVSVKGDPDALSRKLESLGAPAKG